MPNRWLILFVLFFARVTMAFQFQSAAALSPFIADSHGATLADIGLLIGVYLGPGIVVSIPGGSLAARFGDRRVVGWSLATMLTGGLMMTLGESWSLLLSGRVLAGVGGVVVNIVMTKMVVDWFAGREIGTAMGLFISSWPLGITLALLVLPWLAAGGWLALGWLGVVVVIGVALALFLGIYEPAPGLENAVPKGSSTSLPVVPLSLAAAIWALYNTALAMVFGFGPLLLTERGLTATVASPVVSLFTLMVGIGTPIGGMLSDRLGRDPVILFSLVASALFLPLLATLPLSYATPVFAVAGLVMALAPGPIMTLPAQILRPETRAFGMGVFFAVYYAVMMAGPAIAGAIADRAGDAGVALYLGSGMLAVSAVSLVFFRRTAAARPA